MVSNLTELFFHDLKQYNNTNFKTLETTDLTDENPVLYKSCSSVITRYFIFAERHPEISDTEMKMLYYKLNIDRIAKYFSEYPSSSIDDLIPFQSELRKYIMMRRKQVEQDAVRKTVTI